MKRLTYIISILCFLQLIPGCKEEGADLRPGLYVNTDLIDVFPGKVITIGGQASCYAGLQELAITNHGVSRK